MDLNEVVGNMSAARRVLGLPELLTAILENVDERTILLSQRVNTTFHATIERTDTLQRRLFFRADPARANVTAAEITVNFLLARKIPGKPPTGRDGLPRIDLAFSESFMRRPDRYGGHRADEARYLPKTPQGSWQRMLLCQPPVETHVVMYYGDVSEQLAYQLVPAEMNVDTIFHLRVVAETMAFNTVRRAIQHLYADVKAGLVSEETVDGRYGSHDRWLRDLCLRAGVVNRPPPNHLQTYASFLEKLDKQLKEQTDIATKWKRRG